MVVLLMETYNFVGSLAFLLKPAMIFLYCFQVTLHITEVFFFFSAPTLPLSQASAVSAGGEIVCLHCSDMFICTHTNDTLLFI